MITQQSPSDLRTWANEIRDQLPEAARCWKSLDDLGHWGGTEQGQEHKREKRALCQSLVRYYALFVEYADQHHHATAAKQLVFGLPAGRWLEMPEGDPQWDELFKALRAVVMAAETLAVDVAQSGQEENGDDIPPLDGKELAMLKTMVNRAPELLKVDDFTNFARDTVSDKLRSLIDKDYAHRPQGKRGGITATDKGKSIAERIGSPAK